MPNNKNRFVAGFLLVFALLAACSGGHPSLPPATLQSITVTPANPTLKLSRSLQLTATGHYSYGAPKDITASVTWSYSATTGTGTIAVNPTSGLVTQTGGAAGAYATITATDTATGIHGSTTITLMPDAFTVNTGTATDTNDPLATQQWHLKNTGQNAFSDTTGTPGNDINAEPVYSDTTTTASPGICMAGSTKIGCTGYGVKVAVVDTGLEIAHEDLAANVILNGSWNFNNNTTDPTNPATTGDHGTSVAGLIASQVYNGKGGMGVAPEASLKGFNFISSTTQSTAQFVDSLGGSTSNPNSSDVAIFNQSWGAAGTSPWMESTTVINQYASGVSTLRNNKGALYVKAAGNGFYYLAGGTECLAAKALGTTCENANFDNDNTLPYNIVAGALNASGVKSSYSTTGSALWVSAPGGEFGANKTSIGTGYALVVYQPAMVTTDQSGCDKGYAQTATIYSATTGPSVLSAFDGNPGPPPPNTPSVGTAYVLNQSCNYTNTMNGTSSATPVTSGVIALMLEANPNLTWRDVKHILASTSTQVDAARAPVTIDLTSNVPGCIVGGPGNCYMAEQGWVTNKATSKAGAGYAYHNWYGFGVVDASAAVTMAKTCTTPPTSTITACGLSGAFTAYPGTSAWTSISFAGSPSIPDNNATGVTSTINIASGAPAFVEAVQIQVTISHSYWGDLGIELTSPSGTKSILKNIRDGFNYDSTPGTASKTMVLTTNAFYGENSNGGSGWTIRVVDGNNDTVSPSTNNSGGTLSSWGIRIYGH